MGDKGGLAVSIPLIRSCRPGISKYFKRLKFLLTRLNSSPVIFISWVRPNPYIVKTKASIQGNLDINEGVESISWWRSNSLLDSGTNSRSLIQATFCPKSFLSKATWLLICSPRISAISTHSPIEDLSSISSGKYVSKAFPSLEFKFLHSGKRRPAGVIISPFNPLSWLFTSKAACSDSVRSFHKRAVSTNVSRHRSRKNWCRSGGKSFFHDVARSANSISPSSAEEIFSARMPRNWRKSLFIWNATSWGKWLTKEYRIRLNGESSISEGINQIWSGSKRPLTAVSSPLTYGSHGRCFRVNANVLSALLQEAVRPAPRRIAIVTNAFCISENSRATNCTYDVAVFLFTSVRPSNVACLSR